MSHKPQAIYILVLDDSPDDAARLVRRIESAGLVTSCERVQTEKEYRAALARQIDVIFADVAASQLSVRRALDLLKESKLEVPLIVVSRSTSEECGLADLVDDATDVLLKDRLDLVGPVVRRALRNVQEKAERKRLGAELRQSRKMETLGRVACGVAHDFNNLLMAIMADAVLALQQRAVPIDVQESLSNINLSAERGATLTRQLLQFSRRSETHFRPIDLNEKVASLSKMLQRLVGETVPVEFKLAPHPLVMNGDDSMLDQVLLNLVVNARDALSGHGQITVETLSRALTKGEANKIPGASSGRYVGVRVADTGCGIPLEDLRRIFAPSFTTKGARKGTGLGLATVLEVVKHHRGFLDVRSKVGSGTTFEVFLPASESLADPAPEKTSKPETRGGTETILVVEDDPIVRRLIGLALARQGYHILQAADASTALQIWAQQSGPIDLLLTDVALPGGSSGIDLAAQLRYRKRRLKVIFMSGGESDRIEKGFKPGEGGIVVQKPCSVAQLIDVVRKCLDNPDS